MRKGLTNLFGPSFCDIPRHSPKEVAVNYFCCSRRVYRLIDLYSSEPATYFHLQKRNSRQSPKKAMFEDGRRSAGSTGCAVMKVEYDSISTPLAASSSGKSAKYDYLPSRKPTFLAAIRVPTPIRKTRLTSVVVIICNVVCTVCVTLEAESDETARLVPSEGIFGTVIQDVVIGYMR